MVVLFKELREIVAKTDAIQIMVTSIGDVENSYQTIETVPERYNDMEVIGFSALDTIFVKDIKIPLRGVEFYLDDVGHPSESEDDEDLKKVKIRLPKSMVRKMKKVCSFENMSVDEFIKYAVRDMICVNDEE